MSSDKQAGRQVKKIRVLIADDHPLVRQGLRAVFDLVKGIEIVGEAGDGKEAVEKIKQVKPDVVLLDLRMPKVDGVTVCRIVKEENPEIKVIVLTTYDSDEEIFGALEAGASGYLLKDVPPGDLVQAVRMVVRGQSLLHPSVAQRVFSGKLKSSETKPSFDLSPREMDVLRLMTKGLSNREISKALWISESTVKAHASRILHKLKQSDRTKAVLFAIQKGLVKAQED
ncbi:MAG: response regulator transcription factor [Actinomycetota bacterium]|nr:response regulator transcription factor [Actinomycetota bacterium]